MFCKSYLDLYSIEYGTKTRYLMLKLLNFIGIFFYFCKYTLHSTQKFDVYQQLKCNSGSLWSALII